MKVHKTIFFTQNLKAFSFVELALMEIHKNFVPLGLRGKNHSHKGTKALRKYRKLMKYQRIIHFNYIHLRSMNTSITDISKSPWVLNPGL